MCPRAMSDLSEAWDYKGLHKRHVRSFLSDMSVSMVELRRGRSSEPTIGQRPFVQILNSRNTKNFSDSAVLTFFTDELLQDIIFIFVQCDFGVDLRLRTLFSLPMAFDRRARVNAQPNILRVR